MVADHRSESCLRAKYWDEGKSQVEIAEELGVSRVTVFRWMKKHDIETRSYSEIQSDGDVEKLKDEEWLREQYKNKQKSQLEIAEELRVDSRTVFRWIEKHNIEKRSYSESQSDGDVKKLKDEEWLREQYINQERSTVDIADEIEVAGSSVRRWMNKHGIEVHSESERQSDGDVKKLKDEEWLREQYRNKERSIYEIADKLNVSNSTVFCWLRRHEISTRSSIINPEHTKHIVRSEWELEICNILIEEGVNYNYESLEIEYCEGSTYVPDFVTNEYVIEIKGAYFSEIHGDKNTEREKALAAMESLDERDYVVVGKELPADIHIPWEERSKIRELFSNTQPTASRSDCHSTR
jgi:IS30 family transposase